MSIAAAIANAASGLAATTRSTEVVASNVANAMTPGYARRAIELSATVDGGIRVASVERMVSASILAEHRLSRSASAGADVLTTHYAAMEKTLGFSTDGWSLADDVTALETALIAATSRPDDPLRLDAAVAAVNDLVGSINDAARAVSAERMSAESAIAGNIATLNDALGGIAGLNRSIIIEQANGRDAAALMDERQRLIDSIAPIVALREVPRENGRIALFTEGGAVLLDGDTPVDLSFVASGTLSPSMQVGTPPVTRLMVEGEELSGRMMALFGGGALEAQFRIRDEIAPQLQERLDSLALELHDRFADPTLDPTIGPGQSGLFSDAGAMADPLNALGLANRLTINPALATGASSWLLRDGLGATAPGNEGDSTLLLRFADKLTEMRPIGAPGFGTGAYNISTLAAELGARTSTMRVTAQATGTRAAAREGALEMALLGEGVDTDAEMQRLLQLERSYAANAKVIAAADAMIGRLLEI